MQYNASDEKREIANRLYINEEHLWANLVRQYYSPFGAPMRLARPLLEQWHIPLCFHSVRGFEVSLSQHPTF